MSRCGAALRHAATFRRHGSHPRHSPGQLPGLRYCQVVPKASAALPLSVDLARLVKTHWPHVEVLVTSARQLAVTPVHIVNTDLPASCMEQPRGFATNARGGSGDEDGLGPHGAPMSVNGAMTVRHCCSVVANQRLIYKGIVSSEMVRRQYSIRLRASNFREGCRP
jgi:hypothetical protein